ncbi:hypothetical protein GGI25_003126 [Coemansia spiralis]|uniref:Uncharacterized protein n=2 Tax=Coemansia TaxID=4863 RepID=A0A9W8KXU8_9FUNG|nr:hypothetical protein BX070DRAFT_237455 [Coemansia spiralis]KAJ1991758.1 hypothetical protein EDC05_003255 [Coemansia umbellata]KAJ2621737.1 hypothetical protein GGI26_003832 [Coemansia sp. RSA 1358]KAJ2677491.1 hypothetical protein GGI25_003126 [Coemansia spiralis]
MIVKHLTELSIRRSAFNQPCVLLTERHYTGNKSQDQVTFLQPQVNPHGKYAHMPTNPLAKPISAPWTLAERRALFLYYRAVVVRQQIEPDWGFVGLRLNRDPAQCKCICTYTTYNWAGYKERDPTLSEMTRSQILKKIHAGVTAEQLVRLSRGETVREFIGRVDLPTVKWLKKLVTPCEPALLLERGVHKRK